MRENSSMNFILELNWQKLSNYSEFNKPKLDKTKRNFRYIFELTN